MSYCHASHRVCDDCATCACHPHARGADRVRVSRRKGSDEIARCGGCRRQRSKARKERLEEDYSMRELARLRN